MSYYDNAPQHVKEYIYSNFIADWKYRIPFQKIDSKARELGVSFRDLEDAIEAWCGIVGSKFKVIYPYGAHCEWDEIEE